MGQQGAQNVMVDTGEDLNEDEKGTRVKGRGEFPRGDSNRLFLRPARLQSRQRRSFRWLYEAFAKMSDDLIV